MNFLDTIQQPYTNDLHDGWFLKKFIGFAKRLFPRNLYEA